MKPAAQVTFFESGVDWITATGFGGKQTQEMAELGVNLLRESHELGNEYKPWGMAGYHGFKCGPIQMGQRHNELIIRLSSEWAWRYWRDVYGFADNVSRLDVQATIADGRVPSERIKMHYHQGRRFAARRGNAGTLSMYATNNGPSTIYFNKRISDRFGRVYDKAAESGHEHYRGCVRYEVELKGVPAKSMAHALSVDSNSDLQAGRSALQFFSERGLTVAQYFPWLTGESISGQDFLISAGANPRRSVSDCDRQLKWLSKSVKATVGKLITSGRLTDVQEALGLLRVAQENGEHGPSGPTSM